MITELLINALDLVRKLETLTFRSPEWVLVRSEAMYNLHIVLNQNADLTRGQVQQIAYLKSITRSR